MSADSRSAPDALAGALLRSHRTVVLTGLRLGQPEARDETEAGGRWATRANLQALLTDPAAFWDSWAPIAERAAARTPTPGHVALARLQDAGAISALITQAVDRLHLRAGSLDVVEVYGHLLALRCERCGEGYALAELASLRAGQIDTIPRCTECAFPLRPRGTLWGEALDPQPVTRAWDLAAGADLFLVVDCDLRTVPVSLLPSVPLARGAALAIIGSVPTQYDRYAQVISRDPCGMVLGHLADLLAPPP